MFVHHHFIKAEDSSHTGYTGYTVDIQWVWMIDIVLRCEVLLGIASSQHTISQYKVVLFHLYDLIERYRIICYIFHIALPLPICWELRAEIYIFSISHALFVNCI